MERHYTVEVGSGIQFVKFKDSLIDFLIRLNTERRNDLASDKTFVKGLLIAVFSVQKIKEQQNLQTDLLGFIKGKLPEKNKYIVA